MSDALTRHYPHALAAALAAGLAAALVVRVSSAAPAALAIGAAAAGAAARRPGGRLALLLVALALAGWWWGSFRLERLDDSVLAPRIGDAALARAVVTGPVRRGTFALRLPATVTVFGELRVDERVLLLLPPERAPPQGGVIELVVRLERPRAGDDGFDETAWLRRQGVQVVARGGAWRLVGSRGGLLGATDRLRAHVARTLAAALDGEREAVVAGVVLGADEGLPDELRDEFRASGLYHLLAVSGQNVGLVAAGVLVLGWLLGVARWAAELTALAAIASYVLVVGLQPSVVRAGVAGALASLAWLAARPSDRWYFLLAGACVLLAWNPYNLLEPGFQLSFAAVAAIFVAVPRIERRLDGYPVPRALSALIAVALACGVVTAPILWLHFGAVPLYTVLANALAEVAVAPLLALALLGAVLEPLVPAAALALVWAAGWAGGYIAWCAGAVAGLPHAATESARVLLAIAVVGLAVLLLARLPRRGRWAGATVVGSAVVLVAGCALQDGRPPPPPAGLRITVLDVGQGDGILLQTPRHAVLVDQGPPEAEVAKQLRRAGIRALSLLVLTHPQRDHVGGAARVLRSLPVALVLDPRLRVGGPDHREAVAAARERGVRIAAARTGQELELGRLRLRVLWPRDAGTPFGDPNLNAVVIHASFGAFDALLTADAESEVTLPLAPPPVELLKVAHHGSADPGLASLLDLTRPAVAVISVGARNDYGHPSASTLGALRRSGARVLRTDLDGAITIDTDGRTYAVRSER